MIQISDNIGSVDVAKNDFSSICICAVRYALCRRTYMPSIIIDTVGPLLQFLDKKSLFVILRDVKEAKSLGDDSIDRPQWLLFMDRVQRQYDAMETIA